MRLFLDANVLFTAAHNPNGKAALVIDLSQPERWSLATSTYARVEAIRNLAQKAPKALARMDTISKKLSVVEHRPDTPFPPNLVDKDRPIFQAALGWGASHLLTGDLKHFGPTMNRPAETHGVIVQTVAEFLQSVST
ncbi:MAG: DNA-binding protein [Gammaproteobacteria bacterium]|nr:DNA-binding protein [Gammaproteobacteria bacterium]MDE0443943.1 DNA-binding protein [Gammaproteobacteria bacterium]